jgi:hypothetical protein
MLQVGIRTSDGKLVAGAGNVTLGSDGIKIITGDMFQEGASLDMGELTMYGYSSMSRGNNFAMDFMGTELNASGYIRFYVGSLGASLSLKAPDTYGTNVISLSADEVSFGGHFVNTNPYGCKVYRSATQSLPHNTWNHVYFNAEYSDPYGMHSVSTNTDRITVNEKGTYHINGHAFFDLNIEGVRILQIFMYDVSRSSTIQLVDNRIPGVGWDGMEGTTIVDMEPGDFVYMTVFQNSGATLNLTASSSTNHHSASLAVYRLA